MIFNIKKIKRSLIKFAHGNSVKKLFLLREKYHNSKNIIKYFYAWRYHKLLNKYHASIPLSVQFDDVPIFPHGLYGIFISRGAKIGKNCVIFHQVTIGSNTLKDSLYFGAPTLGDNVYIGAGAKIIGKVFIGNNVRIGANCCVARDVPENNTVITVSRLIAHDEPRDNTYCGWG